LLYFRFLGIGVCRVVLESDILLLLGNTGVITSSGRGGGGKGERKGKREGGVVRKGERNEQYDRQKEGDLNTWG